MMADILATARTTPGITSSHVGSLVMVYERNPGRTIPVVGTREPFQTPGKSS